MSRTKLPTPLQLRKTSSENQPERREKEEERSLVVTRVEKVRFRLGTTGGPDSPSEKLGGSRKKKGEGS